MKIPISKLLLDSFDNLLINKHFVILCILKLNQQTIHIPALINSSAFEFGFINNFYIYKYNISMISLDTSQTLKIFDKNHTKYGQIIYIA